MYNRSCTLVELVVRYSGSCFVTFGGGVVTINLIFSIGQRSRCTEDILLVLSGTKIVRVVVVRWGQHFGERM